MKKIAKQKSIGTSVERIKFAIRFYGMDLGSLRQGDWLNLRDDLCQFFRLEPDGTQHSFDMGQGSEILVTFGPPSPDKYKEGHFRKLQKDLRVYLRGNEPYVFPRIDMSDVGFSLVRDFSNDSAHMGVTTKSTRDAFLLTLVFLLFKEGAGNIAKCPECGKVFWRDSARQKYCSRRCTNLFNVKAFHARKKEKDKQKDATKRRKDKKR
jgi:endogenous inhibitor of DNA gyrase (YacG/DUF329 family)